MALIDLNKIIMQQAVAGGILNPDGSMKPAPQAAAPQGVLQSPALSQALLALGSGVAAGNQAGLGLGGALAYGGQAFGNVIQSEKDRQKEAEREATRNYMAALKDVTGMQIQQQELGLRMQQAALQRRAQQDALDARAQERAQAEARRQAVYASGDPGVIRAYEMFGDSAAQSVFMDSMKPKERKIINVDGIPYYEDTKEPVVPTQNGMPPVKPDALVAGLGVAEGARPTPDDAKTIKTVKQAYGQLRTLLPEYESLINEYGSEIEGDTGARKIEQKQAQIALQVKNLEELGALQEADRALIADMMVSPVRKDTVPVLGRLNPTRLLDKGKAQRGAKDFQQYLDDRYSTALQTRGYVDPEFSPMAAKRPDASSGFKTPSGITYEVVE